MSIEVEKAEGLEMEDPFFSVVVAFSPARTEPVELTMAAVEVPKRRKNESNIMMS